MSHPRHRLLLSVLVAGLAALGAVGHAPAITPAIPISIGPGTCTRFASEQGSDSAPGTWRRPFRTVQRLHDSLQSGQTGCIRRGTYTSTGLYVLDVSKQKVAVVGYPGERPRLKGLIVIRRNATGSLLGRVDIEGPGGENVVQLYATDFTLEDSDITNLGRGTNCLMLGDSQGGLATRPTVRRNTFHDCGRKSNGNYDHAIYAKHVNGGTVLDNVIWATSGYALHIYPDSQGVRFAHNVIDGGSSNAGGVIIAGEGSKASSGNIVENNIVAYAATYNIYSYWGGSIGTGNVARDNCVYGGTKGNIGDTRGFTSQGNIVAAPQFVDRSGHDYRLVSGSPCSAVVGYDAAAKLAANR